MDSSQTALQAIQESEVEFQGARLRGALAEDHEIYMPVQQLCEALAIDQQAQTRRIRRTEALADGLQPVILEADDGSRRPFLCLRVDLVPGWLAGISTAHISDAALRAKVINYQRDLFKVAWAVFGPMRAQVVPAGDIQAMAVRILAITERMDLIDQSVAEVQERLRDVQAVVEPLRGLGQTMALLQSELSTLHAELADLEARSRNAFDIAGKRIRGLELRLAPGAAISEEQAARIKEAVAYVANALQERGQPKAYQAVWAAFKTHFSLTEYKMLPQGHFHNALEWLNAWGQSVMASDRPVTPPE